MILPCGLGQPSETQDKKLLELLIHEVEAMGRKEIIHGGFLTMEDAQHTLGAQQSKTQSGEQKGGNEIRQILTKTNTFTPPPSHAEFSEAGTVTMPNTRADQGGI